MRCILLATMFILSCSLSAFSATAPELVVDQPVFDFGTILQGKKVEHVFILKNKGNAPLSIKKTNTSCGCTVAVVSSPVIQPGKSGEIKTTFDSTNFTGKVNKSVSVESDDPQKPVFTLTVKGTVAEEIVISPRQVNFGKFKAGTVPEQTLTVENKGSKKVSFSDVKSSIPQITVTLSKNALSPSESGTIRIKATPRTGDRFLSGYVSMKTSNPNKPLITLPVYGTVSE